MKDKTLTQVSKVILINSETHKKQALPSIRHAAKYLHDKYKLPVTLRYLAEQLNGCSMIRYRNEFTYKIVQL